MTKTLLSFGHGYTARALARRLVPQGWRVIGTTRSHDNFGALVGEGVDPILWPGTELTKALSQATHLLISIAPDQSGDPVLNALSDLIAAAAPFAWTGYLSTTGVYGNHDGGWVDETTPLTPSTERGRHRVLAEKQWQDLAKKQSLNLNIFRLAGIYGPCRGPFAKVRNGTARRIVKPGQVFSRIHVDDIATALTCAIDHPQPNRIYNLCDDDPAPPQDIIEFAAQLLDLPVPPVEDWDTAEMSAMARSFYAESKRVRNDRVKSELGLKLRYPDYRSGLRALLAAD